MSLTAKRIASILICILISALTGACASKSVSVSYSSANGPDVKVCEYRTQLDEASETGSYLVICYTIPVNSPVLSQIQSPDSEVIYTNGNYQVKCNKYQDVYMANDGKIYRALIFSNVDKDMLNEKGSITLKYKGSNFKSTIGLEVPDVQFIDTAPTATASSKG